ncbi:hypothetical protein TNIN_169581 [Trichonephila inaurata madagascariensis]|uniref:Uncharacterized protein n=1 Tax=Trichonephila inaurata madagascariensis TaxID=2747483 RepID=A0A8X6WUW6_9ARAC|nr:hypothetical protein TNIN_169581 [Trichonephila inaurata madagascariensis]
MDTILLNSPYYPPNHQTITFYSNDVTKQSVIGYERTLNHGPWKTKQKGEKGDRIRVLSRGKIVKRNYPSKERPISKFSSNSIHKKKEATGWNTRVASQPLKSSIVSVEQSKNAAEPIQDILCPRSRIILDTK